MNHEYGSSFLLRLLYIVTGAWVKRYSLVALPPLRPRHDRPEIQQRNRDIFIMIMLLASIGSIAVCLWSESNDAGHWLNPIAALAFYRVFDVFVTIFRTGVFFSFRGDIQINREPLWRVRRVLLGVMFNYIEVVLWYSVIYFQLASTSPCQFNVCITHIHQALNLSFTTMTTIGYGGYAPDQLFSTLITFWQAVTGIILLALVVGVLIALLTRDQIAIDEAKVLQGVERPTWWRPLFAFGIVYGIFYILLGLSYC